MPGPLVTALDILEDAVLAALRPLASPAGAAWWDAAPAGTVERLRLPAGDPEAIRRCLVAYDPAGGGRRADHLRADGWAGEVGVRCLSASDAEARAGRDAAHAALLASAGAPGARLQARWLAPLPTLTRAGVTQRGARYAVTIRRHPVPLQPLPLLAGAPALGAPALAVPALPRGTQIAALAPLAWWRHRDAAGAATLLDSGGGGRDGAPSGVIFGEVADGQPGGRYAPGATSDVYTASLAAAFSFNSYSLVLWLRTDGNTLPITLGVNSVTYVDLYAGASTPLTLSTTRRIGSNNRTVVDDAAPAPDRAAAGQWAMVAVTCDQAANALRLYGPTGALLGTATGLSATASQLVPGRATLGGGAEARLADVAIFGRALTPAEVAALAAAPLD